MNGRQFDRLTSLIAGTRGTVVAGGRSDAPRLRIDPTVIAGPAPDEPVMSDEIFGSIFLCCGWIRSTMQCGSSTHGQAACAVRVHRAPTAPGRSSTRCPPAVP